MTTKRFPYPGLGRCKAVVSNGMVYAVATDPQCADGIIEQTKNTLTELTSVFEKAGSGNAGLLQATVYLADVRQKPQMDTVWTEWVGPKKTGQSEPV